MSILSGRQSNSDDNIDKIIRDGQKRLKALSTDLIDFLEIILRVFDENLKLSTK